MAEAGTNNAYFTAAISRHIWNSKYRHREADGFRDADIEATWRRVAHALAAVETVDRAGWEARFLEILRDFRFLPGGRIQAGAGTGHRVTLFNCFVMGTVADSMDGIFDGLKEGAITLQQGGGVGYDFSTLRPAGTPARSVGSVASGPVSFMRIWDSMCATLLSTGARRGAMMATLRCDHPDIEAFIDAKRDTRALRHFNLSVLVSDAFMEALRADADWPLVFPDRDFGAAAGETVMRVWSGETEPVRCRVIRSVRARELWDRIMRATYDYAEPGVLFIDRINEFNNLRYREHISATNPCVTGDTWIHTVNGPRRARDLVGTGFSAVINGNPYQSNTQGFFSSGDRPVFHLLSQEGYSLKLTDDHPVLRASQCTRWTIKTEWVRAGDIKTGDRLILHNHRCNESWPGFGAESEGYLIGLLIGDGTFFEGSAELRVWPIADAVNSESDVDGTSGVMRLVENIMRELPHRRDFKGWRVSSSGYRYIRLSSLTRLAEHLGVRPGNKTVTEEIERCSSSFYRGFLRGLFDSDGSVQGSQSKGVSIRLAQSDEVLLESVQRMLLRLGIVSTIYRNRRDAGPRLLPDGKGGYNSYECRADHELVISGDNLREFSRLVGFAEGHKHARLETVLSGYKRNLNRERFFITVESIEPCGVDEVFDVQIPGINAFDANGIYVHNCGEIPLPPYGACDLGSINLTRFVRRPFESDAEFDFEAVERVARVATRLLDNVIDASRFPLPAQAAQARGSRRVGLGVTGLADTLILLGIAYDSPSALDFAARVMRAICHAAYRASVDLAREKGAFPFFERDAFLAAPFVAALPQDIRAGIRAHGIRNSHLTAIAPTGTISLLANNVSSGIEPVFDFDYRRRVLELDGSYTEYSLRDYARALWAELRPGAVLPAEIFIDTRRLPPRVHIDMQAAAQPYIDNAISKTVNIPRDYDFAAFREVYQYAYDKGLKGCTTFRPNPVTGEILSAEGEGFEKGSHCCDLEREAD